MWGSTPLYIGEIFSVVVRDLAGARKWYEERLGMRLSSEKVEDDSGLSGIALQFGRSGETIWLLQSDSEIAGDPDGGVRPMLYAKNLRKAREWILARGIRVDEMQQDSGGNEFFVFRDLDGNGIEVCREG